MKWYHAHMIGLLWLILARLYLVDDPLFAVASGIFSIIFMAAAFFLKLLIPSASQPRPPTNRCAAQA